MNPRWQKRDGGRDEYCPYHWLLAAKECITPSIFPAIAVIGRYVLLNPGTRPLPVAEHDTIGQRYCLVRLQRIGFVKHEGIAYTRIGGIAHKPLRREARVRRLINEQEGR